MSCNTGRPVHPALTRPQRSVAIEERPASELTLIPEVTSRLAALSRYPAPLLLAWVFNYFHSKESGIIRV